MALDRKKLAVIHIVKKELGLSDDEYRDLLERETGVRSARDLDEEGFYRLMRFFTRGRHYQKDRDSITLRQKLYIRHLAGKLGWDRRHFQNFLGKYYRKKRPEQLGKKEASKVIVALKKILSRQQDGA